MKQFTKLMAMLLFTAATQYSCINDADVAIPDKTHSDSNGNVALFLEIPNVPVSRSAESSGVTEEGSKEEYAVKSLTVYFFDSVTKTFVESQPLENITLAGTSGQKIQYTANKITMKPGTYNVFAIANGEAITGDIATQDKFLGAIDKVTYSTGKIPSVPEEGFVMTNRGAANLNVEVSKPTDSDKVTNISISISGGCIGCGACVALAPEVFELNAANQARVRKQSPEMLMYMRTPPFVYCFLPRRGECYASALGQGGVTGYNNGNLSIF